MVCPNCGAENQENAFCCYNCGGELGTYSYSEPADVEVVEAPKKNGLATASLVCGILSLLCCGISGLPSILAIVFGAIAKSKDKDNKSAKIGLLLGIISIALGVVAGVIIGVLYAIGFSSYFYM